MDPNRLRAHTERRRWYGILTVPIMIAIGYLIGCAIGLIASLFAERQ